MTQQSEVALAMDWGGTWSRVMVADRQGGDSVAVSAAQPARRDAGAANWRQ